jgi:NADPH:quinone reductase-like Zn-dependent oxidoreductase
MRALTVGMARVWMAEQWGSPDTWTFVEQGVPRPGRGEVTIRVRAAGVNPADYKHVAGPRPGLELPVPIGYEVAGELVALGPDTEIASGGGAPGDPVVAFRIQGGYATEVTVPAADVFAKPTALSDEEAANLLLAGSTAAQMLDVTKVGADDTVLVHGASGAVGVSILQQAAEIGARVIGTASESSFARVRRFGGHPVAYGPGLADRVREAAHGPIAAALDTVGTTEAVDVSLELVPDRDRIVTIVAADRAKADGFHAVAGAQPESAAFRDAVRPKLLQLAAEGRLQVPIARTYPLADAPEALRFLAEGHPGGKIALLP